MIRNNHDAVVWSCFNTWRQAQTIFSFFLKLLEIDEKSQVRSYLATIRPFIYPVTPRSTQVSYLDFRESFYWGSKGPVYLCRRHPCTWVFWRAATVSTRYSAGHKISRRMRTHPLSPKSLELLHDYLPQHKIGRARRILWPPRSRLLLGNISGRDYIPPLPVTSVAMHGLRTVWIDVCRIVRCQYM